MYKSDAKSNSAPTLADLNALWRRREETPFATDASYYIQLAERAIALGEPLFACDVCAEALTRISDESPDQPRLRRLNGLALARAGALDAALRNAQLLFDAGHNDEETLGLLARIHKDLWASSTETEVATRHLNASRILYTQAYEATRGYWTGINAATLALIAGDRDEAQRLALEVRTLCAGLRRTDQDDYWLEATLGECALVLGEIEEAKQWYTTAARGAKNSGSLASTRRNAELLLTSLGLERTWLESALPRPNIIVFCGHMLDRGDRPVPRLPGEAESQLAQRIRELIIESDIKIGYASAASGSDILFNEAMLVCEREVHIVLPASPDHFAKESVGKDRDRQERFRRILERAASVTILAESADAGLSYSYANWVLLGLARIRARQTGGIVKACAVWDGERGDPGGTATAVHDWRAFGADVLCLHPTQSAARVLPAIRNDATPLATTESEQRIICMLFGDAVGFSKLEERQILRFVEKFLGNIANLISDLNEPPLTRNTWGDGFYFTFSSPLSAGLLALSICEMIARTEWALFGLPPGLGARIALHAGPAYEVFDPVIGQRNFNGVHVSRAARIEPITPAGQVYASQAFAALCECTQVTEFACEYVGQLPLAKKYGTHPMFHVRRTTARRTY
jgi:class 3 adenylate cyclase/tetratricopeptide (TPR) repeat protein